MKSRILISTLLGSAGVVSAADLSSVEADTWCIAYLSTYLAPVSNQVYLPSTRRELSVEESARLPAEEPGRLPIPVAPPLWPTFCCMSDCIDRVTGTELEEEFASDTSLIISESFETSGLAPVDSESSSLGIEPTEVQSGSGTLPFGSTTGALTDQLITSSIPTDLDSTASTGAIPTSSGLIEPAGRYVIFLILTRDDEKRNINKRATTGGFVGNDNPKVCTFAATFNLAQGQLWEGGVPIHYSGEVNKELPGQGRPDGDSITKTFSISGQQLAFRNSGLPNGEAGFCQTPDGKVHVTFTTGPPGCVAVNLAAYDVAQCKNGRLIGLDDLTSTTSEIVSSETVEPEEITSGSTDGIEDATTSRVPASTDSNDSEASTKALEPTGTIIPPSEASFSGFEEASEEPTSLASTPDGPDDTASVPSSGSTSQLSSEATDPAGSTTASASEETTPSTSDTTSGTVIDIETPATDATTNTDTATGSDTTADLPTNISASGPPDPTTTNTAPTDPAAVPCSDIGSPYQVPNGARFDVSCDTGFRAYRPIDRVAAGDLIDCMRQCSETDQCIGVQFDKDNKECSLVSESLAGTYAVTYYDTALRITPTDTTPDLTTTTTTTTSDVPGSAKPSDCNQICNPYQASNGRLFSFICNAEPDGYDQVGSVTGSFVDCLEACSQDARCTVIRLSKSDNECLLLSNIYGRISSNNDYHVGFKDLSGDPPTGTAITHATTPDILTVTEPAP
ncbi:hypothetical protein F53441_3680 [Fusarium austroafricanum]|uniref:Apple domain-containing protein n=1 Tax=Fusarium austroafricanum TaxID=2364996 RepID=A0A8H4KPJ3_9HYPO|nr:hypothetical protein F53441_3680 [Fusarium austroafricanum]